MASPLAAMKVIPGCSAEVLGVLACVDFETGYPAVGVAREQRTCQAGGTAAELDDFAAGERHQVRQKIKFVVNQRQGFDGGNHWEFRIWKSRGWVRNARAWRRRSAGGQDTAQPVILLCSGQSGQPLPPFHVRRH